MNNRYCSASLSRSLAEAGLAQAEREMVWCACRCASVDGAFRLKNDCHVCREYSVEPGQSAPCLHPAHIRALRLDDVLEELTRDREGGPLAYGYYMDRQPLHPVTFTALDKMGCSERCGVGERDVESAGLVLLALLRERANP